MTTQYWKKRLVPVLALAVLTAQMAGCSTSGQTAMESTAPSEMEVVVENAEPSVAPSVEPEVESVMESLIEEPVEPEVPQISKSQLRKEFLRIYNEYGDDDTAVMDALAEFAEQNGLDPDELSRQYQEWKEGYVAALDALAEIEHRQIFNEAAYVCYASTDLNIRASYSEDSEVLGMVYAGYAINVVGIGKGEAEGWLEIDSDGQTGYVSAWYVLETPFTAEESTMYIVDSAPIRSSWNSDEDNIIKTGSRGDSVAITGIGIGVADGWYRIDVNGQTGYVYETHVSSTKPVISTGSSGNSGSSSGSGSSGGSSGSSSSGGSGGSSGSSSSGGSGGSSGSSGSDSGSSSGGSFYGDDTDWGNTGDSGGVF